MLLPEHGRTWAGWHFAQWRGPQAPWQHAITLGDKVQRQTRMLCLAAAPQEVRLYLFVIVLQWEQQRTMQQTSPTRRSGLSGQPHHAVPRYVFHAGDGNKSAWAPNQAQQINSPEAPAGGSPPGAPRSGRRSGSDPGCAVELQLPPSSTRMPPPLPRLIMCMKPFIFYGLFNCRRPHLQVATEWLL